MSVGARPRGCDEAAAARDCCQDEATTRDRGQSWHVSRQGPRQAAAGRGAAATAPVQVPGADRAAGASASHDHRAPRKRAAATRDRPPHWRCGRRPPVRSIRVPLPGMPDGRGKLLLQRVLLGAHALHRPGALRLPRRGCARDPGRRAGRRGARSDPVVAQPVTATHKLSAQQLAIDAAINNLNHSAAAVLQGSSRGFLARWRPRIEAAITLQALSRRFLARCRVSDRPQRRCAGDHGADDDGTEARAHEPRAAAAVDSHGASHCSRHSESLENGEKSMVGRTCDNDAMVPH